MQQETQTSKPSAGAIVAIVGGIMLAIGSFLTWATVSVDTTELLNKLADTLGVSADQLQGVPTDSFSQSVSGWDGSDGKITLVVAIIIIIAAILMFAMPRIRKAMGVIVILAGLAGGGVAVYDATRVKDVANDAESAAASAAGSGLDQLGLSADDIFDGVFDVTPGIGRWVCIAGGVIAMVGGVLALRERPGAAPAAM
ncbi:MAG TPA: Trp biosynthesis-associated membrane protein, partial [Actinomycetota bacterium]|nr:Trp biosynthesis-associated membrane protein [Actinomycetota bacterium]